MGANCVIHLPGDVRVDDVAEVCGILAGLPFEWTESGKAKWVTVPGASVKTSSSTPEMVTVLLEGKLIDGTDHHFAHYFFEDMDRGTTDKVFHPTSNPFWCAVGKGLVDFFGGKADWNDCDKGSFNYRKAKPRKTNAPSKDEPWDEFQLAVSKIKPLTKKDLKAAEKVSAYGLKE